MIKKRTLKNGEARYDFRGRLADGRVYSKTFRTKVEAKQYEARFIGERAAGSFLDPKRGEIAFSVWASQVLDDESQWKTLKSRTRDRSVFDTRLRPILGDLPINAITTARVQAVVNSWAADGLMASTIRTYHAVLRSILQVAVDAELIPKNPASRTKLPPVKPRQRRLFSAEETMRVAETLGPEWRLLPLLMAELGLRWGEAIGLRVCDVDFDNRALHISQNITEVSGTVEIGPPKTAAGTRVIAASDYLMAEIQDHITRSDLHESNRESLLLAAPNGEPLRYSNFRRRVWAPALRKAGLPPGGFHDLRHSAATLWIANGVDPRTAQHRLGHETPNLTLAVYTHLSEQADRRAAEIASQALWGPRGDSSSPK